MSVPLYMDVHVDARISRRLRERNCDVLTSQEDGTREWPDSDLLDRATVLGRVLFTQDKDFLREATTRQRLGIPFSGIIFSAQISGSLDQVAADLELIAMAATPDELTNQVQYLPLKRLP